MNYEPKTEEQLAQEALLPDGIYDFEVIETNDKPSKKGNDMITLKLRVFDRDGDERHIFDYIAMGNHFGERKLRLAAAACGLLPEYDSGKLTDRTFLDASGKVSIKQQKGTEDYPLPKNVVADYIKRDTGVANTRPSKEIIDDDLPF